MILITVVFLVNSKTILAGLLHTLSDKRNYENTHGLAGLRLIDRSTGSFTIAYQKGVYVPYNGNNTEDLH